MAAIRNGHRVEHGQERRWNPGHECRPLGDSDPRRQMRPKLANLGCPPGQAARSLDAHVPVRNWVIGKPTWSKTNWSGPSTPVRSGMKIRASRTYCPYWYRIGVNWNAVRGGKAARRTRVPSSGGTGIRLKMNKMTLISTKIPTTFKAST